MKNKFGILLWALVIFCLMDVLYFLPKTSLPDGWRGLFSSHLQKIQRAEPAGKISLGALSELPPTVGELKGSLKSLAASLSLLKQTDAEMQKTLEGTRRLNGLLSDEERLLTQAVVYLKPLAFHSGITNKLTLKATQSTRKMEKTIKNSSNVSGGILTETRNLYARAKNMRDSMEKTLVAMQNVKNKLPKNLPK